MTAFEEGARVRLIHPARDLTRNTTFPVGTEFEFEEFELSEDHAIVSDLDGMTTGRVFAVVDLEVVASAAQMAQRTPPSPAEVAKEAIMKCHDTYDGFEIDESETVGNDTVELIGTTAEGLRFAALVKVLSTRRVDF